MRSMNLPDATFFEGGLFPSREFELAVEHFEAGQDVRTDVRFKAHYDRHGTLRLELTPALHPRSLLDELGPAPTISGSHTPERVDLMMVSSDAHRTIFVPKLSPRLIHHSQDASVVRAVLINGPRLGDTRGEMKFREGDLTVTLEEFPGTSAFRDDQRMYQFDCIATGTLTLTADQGRLISAEEAFRKISRVAKFFTLLRGGSSAIGHIIGYAPDGASAFAFAGFNKADPFKVEAGWCDNHVIRRAPDIYRLYSDAVSDPDQCKVVLRAIDYYRASNVAHASSGSVALVASYAALEALVPYILLGKAGWSSSRVKRLEKFHKKIDAAVQFIGLSGNLLEHSPEIEKRVTMETGQDAISMLSTFRNRMTHYEKGFTSTGVELWEMWMFSQWLCEVFILYLIGYRDDMRDRRRYNGWVEAPSKVPLP